MERIARDSDAARRERRTQELADSYPSAAREYGASQRAAARASERETASQTAEGDVVRWFTNASGQRIPITTPGGADHVTRSRGAKFYTDPATGQPLALDMNSPGGVADAWASAPVKRDAKTGMTFKDLPWFGRKEIGVDPVWQNEQAQKKMAAEQKAAEKQKKAEQKQAADSETAAEAERKRQEKIQKIGIGASKRLVETYDGQFAAEVSAAKEKSRLNAADIRSDEARVRKLDQRLQESSDPAEREALTASRAEIERQVAAKQARQEELEADERRAAVRKEAWTTVAKPAMTGAIAAAEKEAKLKLLTNTGRHEIGPPGAVRNPDPKPGEPAFLPGPAAVKPGDSKDGFREQPDGGKPLLLPGMTLLPNGQPARDGFADLDELNDNLARRDSAVNIDLSGMADAFKGRALSQVRPPIAGRTVPSNWLTDEAAIAQRTAREVGKAAFHLPPGYAVDAKANTITFRDTPAGRVGRDKFGLPRIYSSSKHSPSLASGNPYDGVPEYAEVSPAFRDYLRTQEGYDQDEDGIRERWAAQAWKPGKVKQVLDRWQGSNDHERAGLIVEMQPELGPAVEKWQAGETSQMPRLDVRGLYRSGQISLQEARLLERTLYGTQPGTQLDAKAHFEAWRRGDTPAAQTWQQAERMLAVALPGAGGFGFDRKQEAFGQAFSEWRTQYLAENSGRLDFDRERFVADAKEIAGDEFNWLEKLFAWQERGTQNVAGSLVGILNRALGSAAAVPASVATLAPESSAGRGVMDMLWGRQIDQARFKTLQAKAAGKNGQSLSPEEVLELKALTFQQRFKDGRTGGIALSRQELVQGLDDTVAWVKGVGATARRIAAEWTGGGTTIAADATALFDAVDRETLTESELVRLANQLEDKAFAAQGWPTEWRADSGGRYNAANDESPLAAVLVAYRQTGDPAYRDQFTSMLLSTPEQMRLQAAMSEYASKAGIIATTDAFAVFKQSARGMRVAGLQEFVSEVAGDVLGAGVGKALVVGARGISRVARAGAGAGRVSRATALLDKLIVAGTNPATPIRNALIQGAKIGVAGGAQEYLEEGLVAVGEPTADLSRSFHEAGMEGLAGGVAMGVQNALLGAGLVGLQNYRDTRGLRQFVNEWNRRTPDDAITVADARQAFFYVDPAQEAAHDDAVFKAGMQLAMAKQRHAANEAMVSAESAQRGVVALSQMEVRDAEAVLTDLATQKEMRIAQAVEAAREVNSIADPALRQFADAAVKVARGQPLTEREMTALEGARAGVPPGPVAQPMPALDPKTGKPIEGLPPPAEPGQPLARRVKRGNGMASPADGWIITDPGLEALRRAIPRTTGLWLPADERSQELLLQNTLPDGTQATPHKTSMPAERVPGANGTQTPSPQGAGVPASPPSVPQNVPHGTTTGLKPAPGTAQVPRWVVPVTVTAATGAQRVQEVEVQAASPQEAAAKVGSLPAWRAIQSRGATVTVGQPVQGVAAGNGQQAQGSRQEPQGQGAGQQTASTRQEAAEVDEVTWQEQQARARAQVKPLATVLKDVATAFSFKVVDTGLPFGFTDRYGTFHSLGTQIFDKAVPGSDLGQWIDHVANSPVADMIRENMTRPGLHRVWFGHDPLANLGTILEKFGPTALPEWALQLLKDSTTRSGIPLPGVQWLVHKGVVGDVAATEWLSMNIGEALGAGLGIIGTYKLFRKARDGQEIHSGWALLGIAFKLVGGVLSANPVLLLLGVADAAILVGAKRGWMKAGFQKARQESQQKSSRQEVAAPGEGADLRLLQRVPIARAVQAMASVPPGERANAAKLLVRLDAVLDRFGALFAGGIEFATTSASSFAAVRKPDGTVKLRVSLPFFLKDFADTKTGAAVEATIKHEFIHLAALNVMEDREVSGLWRALPRSLKQLVWSAYHAASIKDGTLPAAVPDLPDFEAEAEADGYRMGHEFVRMLIEDREFAGQVTEAIEVSPTLGRQIIEFLQKLVSELRRMVAGLEDADLRNAIDEYANRVAAELKRLMGSNLTADLGAKGALVARAPAGPTELAKQIVPSGKVGTAYTEGNEAIEFEWAVADVSLLNASNTDDGRIDPTYPQELQPRDRTSAASEAQVNDIANNANLDRLSHSEGVGTGAPMVGPDGVVESGNGRVMGLRRAYLAGNGPSAAYRQNLLARAGEFGLTPEQIASVQHPVLVRVRRTEVDRAAFAQAANVGTVAPMREVELARRDAGNLRPALFENFAPSEDGDIFTAANAEFVRAFVREIVPQTERAAMVDRAGNLTQTGLRRIRNAVFAYAYGTDAAALAALGRLTEAIDAGGRNVVSALLSAAPVFADQAARMEAGALHPVSITGELVQAVTSFNELRDRGETVADYLAHGELAGIGPARSELVEEMLKWLEDNKRSARRLAATLTAYAQAVEQAGDPRQGALFGDGKAPSKEQVWRNAVSEIARQQEDSQEREAAAGLRRAGMVAQDMQSQLAWLDDQARKEGHENADALAAADFERFVELASAWREGHPVGETVLGAGRRLPDVPGWSDLQAELGRLRTDASLSKEARKEAIVAVTERFHASNPTAQAALDERQAVAKLTGKIPPAWTEVEFFPDSDTVLVRGRDAQGRVQAIYSSAHSMRALAEKFERGRRVNEAMPRIVEGVERGLQRGDEAASVLRLILLTGFRIGGKAQGGKVEAFGASSLRADHVRISGDEVEFAFVGKLGVAQNHVVLDAGLAADLEPRVRRGGALFAVRPEAVREYLRRAAGMDDIIVHDLRTWNATALAAKLVAAEVAPETATDFWLKRDAVADVVARKLGDTRTVVLEHYIDAMVFANWRQAANVGQDAERPRISRKVAKERGRAGELEGPHSEYERALRDDLLPSPRPTGRPGPDPGRQLALELASPARKAELRDRSEMPQITAAMRGRMIRWLEARGVAVWLETKTPGSLRPMQTGTVAAKVEKARNKPRGRRVIVSRDLFILDGHHQWQVAMEEGREAIPVVRINASAHDALAMLHEFESVASSRPGTRYETEDYQYLGPPTEEWRTAPQEEARVVNPIDPTLSPDEKVEALNALSRDNVPLVKQILDALGRELGLRGKYSVKEPDRIQAKASRPEIRSRKPWHDIEHIRDGLRFKVSLDHFEKIPAIMQVLLDHGAEVIKFDSDKLFNPKEFGWRFIAWDLRLPNGQLVEFYAPLPALDDKNVKGPNHVLFEKWRNRNPAQWDMRLREYDPAVFAERLADIRQSFDTYKAAFLSDLARMGYASEREAMASFDSAVARAASLMGEKYSMDSTAEGGGAERQTPSFLRAPGGETYTSPNSLSSAAYTSSVIVENTPNEARKQPAIEGTTHVFPDGAALTGPGMHELPASLEANRRRAYHGTPHKVDQFRLGHIGTGEGSQVYGWGLYFAENRSVAETYRATGTAGIAWRHAMKTLAKHPHLLHELENTLESDFGIYSFAQSLPGDLAGAVNLMLERSWWSDKEIDVLTEALSPPEQGNLYTVDLLGEDDAFLDWDKPLREQSELVRAAWPQSWLGPYADFTGEALYNKVSEKPWNFDNGYVPVAYSRSMRAPERASRWLLSKGVLGVRYHDQQSRRGTAQKRTSNYVIFDERLVRILEENGTPVGEAERMAASGVRRSRRGNENDASGDLFAWGAESNTGFGLLDLLTPEQQAAKQSEKAAGTRSIAPAADSASMTQNAPAGKWDEKAQQALALAKQIEGLIAQNRPVSWTELFALADTAFGGSQANGAYTPKDAYDALEMGFNRWVTAAGINPGPSELVGDEEGAAAVRAVLELKRRLGKIPTQTKRTEETDAFQQFSTVPSLAFVANWVARVSADDVMLEPSAGPGGLAVFAKNAGSRVIGNELSPRRAALLRASGIADEVFSEDAEQINNILPGRIRPTVVVMNPPFSNAATRGVKGKTATATRHIEQALARLEEGGRLVAIVGEGMAMDKPAFRGWWDKMRREYSVRANVQVNGAEYGKYGTTWDNQILVIDKVKPSGQPEPITGRVEKVEELVGLLQIVRNERPAVSRSDASERGGTRPPRGTRPGGSGLGAGGTGAAPPAGPARPDTFGGGLEGGAGEDQGSVGGGPAGPAVDRAPDGDTAASAGPGSGAGSGAVTTTDALTDSVYDAYVPQIVFPGAHLSPTPLSESAAMAAVSAPQVTYRPVIPAIVYADPNRAPGDQRLAAHALESITLAGAAHQQFVPATVWTENEAEQWQKDFGTPPPTEYRRGFFVGDGAGAGKGRQVGGIILDNWLQGRKKHLWISEKPGLMADALRDLKDVTGNTAELAPQLFPVGKVKAADRISRATGIGFISYATLRSEEKTQPDSAKIPRTRVDQLVEWLGPDFDGVIAFDESHNMANIVPVKGARGNKEPSLQAQAGLELQRRLPNARVVYLSATGATEVENLGYAERLGIWGPGTPFQRVTQFITNVGSGGVAAMEIIAQNLKAMGLYVARSLSWAPVTYEQTEHELTPEQRQLYDTLAEVWQSALKDIYDAMAVTGITEVAAESGETVTKNGRKKGNIAGKFWGAHQRFFAQIITTLKMPTVLREVEKALADGNSAVLQLVNTNHANTDRAAAKAAREAAENGEDLDLESVDLTPKEELSQMVMSTFPTVQYETVEVTDTEGNVHEISRPVKDSQGNVVENQEALAMRDALLDRLSSVRVPQGPLEILTDHFGHEAIAEITGRQRRLVWAKDRKSGEMKKGWETRTKKHLASEIRDFQEGKRRVLVFSRAGGTGESYHSDRRAKNQQKRIHFLLQPGWQAAAVVQGLGRTHRNNQAVAPHYVLAATDIAGERRFISSVARRLDQLGALTKGQRQTGSQGLFSAEDNLESTQADEALKWFYREAMAGRIPRVRPDVLEKEMGLKMRDKDGQVLQNLPPIRQFLNRLLSLSIEMQDAVFEAFFARVRDIVEAERSAGTLDVGMETLWALSTVEKGRQEVYKDTKTGASAELVSLELTQPNVFQSWEAWSAQAETGWVQPYVRQKSTGKILAVTKMTEGVTEEGVNFVRIRVTGPTGHHWYDANKFWSLWEKVPGEVAEARAIAKASWEEQRQKAGETYKETRHLLVGTMLPIWNKIPGYPFVYRAQTDAGQRMIGRSVADSEVNTLLNNLGKAGRVISPEAAVQVMLERGAKVRLVNNWKLHTKTVSGEQRIELTGPSMADHPALDKAGVFKERIQWNMRYFLPLDRAAEVLANVLQAFNTSIAEAPGASLGAGRRQSLSLREGEIQGYFDAFDVPPEKQPQAKKEIATALNGHSNAPYSLPGAGGAVRRGPSEQERERARRAWRGLREGDTAAVKAAFAESDTISNLLHQYIRREIPAFDIRGAIINSPADLAAFNLAVRTPYFETLKIAVVDASNQVVHSEIAFVGALSDTIANPYVVAHVLRNAQMANPKAKLAGFLLAHNHPSGNPHPSTADVRATEEFDQVGAMLGLPLIDHVITNGESYFSFRERGLPSKPSEVHESIRQPAGPRRAKPKLPVLPTPEKPHPGHLAPWEVVPAGSTSTQIELLEPRQLRALIYTVRTADPGHYHIFYTDTRRAVRAVERVPADATMAQLVQRIAQGAAREGAAGFHLGLARRMEFSEENSFLTKLAAETRVFKATLFDAITVGAKQTAKEAGIFEPGREYGGAAPLAASRRQPGAMPAGSKSQVNGTAQFLKAQEEAAAAQAAQEEAERERTLGAKVKAKGGAAGIKREAAEAWANVVSGNIDRLEFYAPGFLDIWLDSERKLGLARAAVNGVMEKLNDRAKAGFGYPAWWKQPLVWRRWKQFQAELLPVAARLEVAAVATDGSFVFQPFDMRAGEIDLRKVHAMGKKAGDPIVVNGETLVIGRLFEETASSFTQSGVVVKKHLLLRPMSASAQQQVYEAFAQEWAEFPVARELLDEFIMPGMAGAREVGPRGVRTAAFNRYALLDFFNEWPPELQHLVGQHPMPAIPQIAGYTPDLFTLRGLSFMLAGLAKAFKSGARQVKSGAARESGNVKNLLDGFQTRLMEAHREKISLERRARVIEAAARPMNQVPQEDRHKWLALNAAFHKLYEVAVVARGLDRARYPKITGALNPDQETIMRQLVGEAWQLRGRNLAVPEAIYTDLVGELAVRDAENLLLRIIEWFIDRFNSASLATSGYIAMNWLGNEIMKTSYMLGQALKAGALLAVAEPGRARVAFDTFAHMAKGMVVDRFPLRQQRIRDVVPRELFDNEQAIRALKGLSESVVDNLKAVNMGGAILAAMKAGNWDVGAKVQLAHAAYRAAMLAAWRDAGRPAGREKWMREWLENDAPATLHREVQLAAALYLMDYQNVPRWMDAAHFRPVVTDPDHPARGIIGNQVLRLGVKLLIPFIRWQYSFAKAVKRQAWNDGLKKLVAGGKVERAEGAGTMAALGLMVFLPGLIAVLKGGDEDDDALENELIGRVQDLEGGKLPQTLSAKNRFNASGLLRILATRMGMDGLSFSVTDAAGDESDLWLRYRNYPYVKEGIVLGLAAVGDNDAFGQSWASLFQEYASLGLAWQVAETLFGARDQYGTPEAQLGGMAADVALSPVLPHRLLRDANILVDPTDRRLTPSKRLDYQPGFAEGMMSRVPGLRDELPMAGEIRQPKVLLLSVKSSVPAEQRAELERHFGIEPGTAVADARSRTDVFADLAKLRQLGGDANDVRVVRSAQGKPMIAYPDPDTVRRKDSFWEAVRSASAANLLPVKREAYRAAVRGGSSDEVRS